MSKKTYSILLVEDDQRMAHMVTLYLQQEGWEVTHIGHGQEALTRFADLQPHLLILDIMLPGLDGIELCRRVRAFSTVPILMLTARQSDVDKAVSLGTGADDYLSKPFSTTELIARIRALLRRAYEFSKATSTHLNTAVFVQRHLGGPRLHLFPEEHHVTLDGQRLELTPIEFDILHLLMEAPGWVQTRAQILQAVWGYTADSAGEETVTVHVNNMRRKLGAGAQFVRTVRGVGYAYEEPSEPDEAPSASQEEEPS